jgi:hypothetical protein
LAPARCRASGSRRTDLPPLLPSTADRDLLLDLGSDIFDSWYAGAVDEYFNSATRIWEWNTTEAGNDDDWDQRLGLSALCAALYRYSRPRDQAKRLLWRRLALETVDQWFANQQDPITGGMWRYSVGDVANDSGTVTYFGFAQVAIIARCLNVPTRWATQIADALDYTVSRGDHAYYTNGNIMFLKLVGFELGALSSGEDAAARARVEALWDFTVTPTEQQAALGNPDRWRGCGYIDDGDGAGYFSETTSTGSGIDHTGTNRLDWIYTDAQSTYAILGYLLYGDERYATYSEACTRKMEERYNYSTNQFATTGGSRNPGVNARNISGLAHFVLGWIRGEAHFEENASGILNHGVQGLDVDFRRYLNLTHSTFVRQFGLNIATSIIAAHGKVFS